MSEETVLRQKRASLPEFSDQDILMLAQGNTAFALDLYARLRDRRGNLFFSPFSITNALAMTYAGARTRTEEQMRETLHFSISQPALHHVSAALNFELQANALQHENRLFIANALWGQRSYSFEPDFCDLLAETYDAPFNEVDFDQSPEAARAAINDWAEAKTKGCVKELIAKVTPLCRLVLTNAIYFLGKWKNPFDHAYTRSEPFTVKASLFSEKKIQVPMMRQTDRFAYLEEPTFQALELLYVGEELAMLILLPKKIGKLAELEAWLTPQNLDAWTAKLRPCKVQTFLPKFKINWNTELSDPLAAMGMPDAFSRDRADFSGITHDSDGLYIAKVIHNANVDVGEEGTEAAAATAVLMDTWSAPPEPMTVFRADHPFVFLIRDCRTKIVLFVGRLVNPS